MCNVRIYITIYGSAIPFSANKVWFNCTNVFLSFSLSVYFINVSFSSCVTESNRWSPPTLLPIIITKCALDIVTLTHRTGCRLEITRGGPLSCSHLSFFPPPPQCSQLFPAGKGSLNECLLCYGFIGLVCGRNLWIKVISHCSTFSQAVKLPFTFVPLREQDRERHM